VYQVSEANTKEPAQHKSLKVTHSGPQHFFSGAVFGF